MISRGFSHSGHVRGANPNLSAFPTGQFHRPPCQEFWNQHIHSASSGVPDGLSRTGFDAQALRRRPHVEIGQATPKMIQKHKPRNSVHLTAFNSNGQQVLEERLTVHKFYEESHPVLDEADYRMSRQIVRFSGLIYDAQGEISQEFEVCFDASGLCVSDAARFADGTTAGPWEKLKRI